jgi:long-subunit fatty acid transport protein
MALGNAMAAISEGWESVHYNPAALALSHDVEFSIGVFSAIPNITTEVATPPDPDPRQPIRKPLELQNITGPAFGFVLPIERLTPKRLPMPWAIGMGCFIPRQTLTTTRVIKEGFPYDVIFQERNETLAFNFGISTRITSAVYLGLGLISQIKTTVELLYTPYDARALESEARLTTPSFLGGILVRPLERLRLGLVYRQKSEIGSIRSFSFRFGEPGQVLYVLGYAPENMSFGAAYRITERFRISGELTWYRWSAYTGVFDRPLEPSFDDILVPRIGLLYRITRKLEARAGFYYEPTPVTNQATGMYPFGNDRFVPSIGVGYTFPAPWGILAKPLSVDAYFQYHILAEKEFTRDVPLNPGAANPDLTSSGSVFSLGLELTFRF